MGHDGTLVRLLAGLGRRPTALAGIRRRGGLRGASSQYPLFLICISTTGMGGCRRVRVFHEGTVLGRMEWVQLDEFVGRLRVYGQLMGGYSLI